MSAKSSQIVIRIEVSDNKAYLKDNIHPWNRRVKIHFMKNI